MKPEKDSILSIGLVLAYYKLSSKLSFNYPMKKVFDTMRSFKNKREIIETFRRFLNNPGVPQVFKDMTRSLLLKRFDPFSDEKCFELTAIYVPLDGRLPKSTLEKPELEIERLTLQTHEESYIYGFRLLNHYYVKTEEKVAPAFMFSQILIIVVLFIGFRNFGDIAISLLSLFLAVLWTMGIVGFLRWELDLMSSMVPILTFGLGIDFSFHVLLNFKENLKDLTVKAAMKRTLRETGTALFLAMITTAVGFLSNAVSSISSMKHFGFIAAISIFFTFVLNLTFVPAMRILMKNPKKVTQKSFKTPKE